MPSQAQKHVTRNDALVRLDALVQLSVEDRDRTVPPPARSGASAISWPPVPGAPGPGAAIVLYNRGATGSSALDESNFTSISDLRISLTHLI